MSSATLFLLSFCWEPRPRWKNCFTAVLPRECNARGIPYTPVIMNTATNSNISTLETKPEKLDPSRASLCTSALSFQFLGNALLGLAVNLLLVYLVAILTDVCGHLVARDPIRSIENVSTELTPLNQFLWCASSFCTCALKSQHTLALLATSCWILKDSSLNGASTSLPSEGIPVLYSTKNCLDSTACGCGEVHIAM